MLKVLQPQGFFAHLADKGSMGVFFSAFDQRTDRLRARCGGDDCCRFDDLDLPRQDQGHLAATYQLDVNFSQQFRIEQGAVFRSA